MGDSDWRFEIDGLPLTLSVEQKDTFLDEVIKYFVIIKCQPMPNQFIDGLKYYDVSVLRSFQNLIIHEQISKKMFQVVIPLSQ